LKHYLFTTIVRKATEKDDDAYSAFQNTGLAELLAGLDVDEVYVCGLATDFCVKATVIDCIDEGFETIVLPFACRAVTREGEKAAFIEMEEAGAIISFKE
jgi:nicotinamidase/pyrazinamidase